MLYVLQIFTVALFDNSFTSGSTAWEKSGVDLISNRNAILCILLQLVSIVSYILCFSTFYSPEIIIFCFSESQLDSKQSFMNRQSWQSYIIIKDAWLVDWSTMSICLMIHLKTIAPVVYVYREENISKFLQPFLLLVFSLQHSFSPICQHVSLYLLLLHDSQYCAAYWLASSDLNKDH